MLGQIDLFGGHELREQRRIGHELREQRPARHAMEHLRLGAGDASDTWRTPSWLVRAVDAASPGLGFDVACTSVNAVSRSGHGMHVDRGLDGLTDSWTDVWREQLGGWKGLLTGTVWCNPPYGAELPAWMQRCAEQSVNENVSVIALVPARVETRWWHDYVVQAGASVAFLVGRVAFCDDQGIESSAPPHASALIGWRRPETRHAEQWFGWVDSRKLRALAEDLDTPCARWAAHAEVRSLLARL